MATVKFKLNGITTRRYDSKGHEVYSEDDEKGTEKICYDFKTDIGHGHLMLTEDEIGGRNFNIGDTFEVNFGMKNVGKA